MVYSVCVLISRWIILRRPGGKGGRRRTAHPPTVTVVEVSVLVSRISLFCSEGYLMAVNEWAVVCG